MCCAFLGPSIFYELNVIALIHAFLEAHWEKLKDSSACVRACVFMSV